MRLDVFCAWGDGPDVGINVHRTPQERDAFNGHMIPLDFTAAEARALAARLVACAEHAEWLDRECAALEAAGNSVAKPLQRTPRERPTKLKSSSGKRVAKRWFRKP